MALDKAERLEDLLNEFFDITRFNLTHLELERRPVDLALMLRQAAGREESGLPLTFTNTGTTIPPGKLSRIFEQFFRLDSARASGRGGAGLGLAIAKEMVQLRSGTISAQSKDGVTTIAVRLPNL